MHPQAKPIHAATVHIVQAILDYLENNLLETLTPAGIAGAFFMSESALGILFRMVCDMPVMEYVRNRRLTLAGQTLMQTNARIIDLALQYGYETPEAFAKAFTRFHGHAPSMCRRICPQLRGFSALRVQICVQGGWNTTDSNALDREKASALWYADANPNEGGVLMKKEISAPDYSIRTQDMTFQEDWKTLLALARMLGSAGIAFKVDGKTMVFAHGLEFHLEKICLTFKWPEERQVLACFGHAGRAVPYGPSGYKYFDANFCGRIVRCMFYGDCPGDDTDAFLFRDTDVVSVDGQRLRVQSLAFYYENADAKDACYAMVERHLKGK